MPKTPLVHGFWTCATIAAFVLGSHYFPGAITGRRDVANTSISGGSAKSTALRGERNSGTGQTPLHGNSSALSGPEKGNLLRHPVGALTAQEILALGKAFKANSNPIERRLAFSRLLEGLTSENGRLIRAQIEHLSENSSEFREFHYAWGALAGEAAVLHGKDTAKQDMAATFRGWASADPTAAMTWYEGARKLEGLDHNSLKWGALFGLAHANPGTALEFVLRRGGQDKNTLKRMTHVVTSEVLRGSPPAEAAAWVEAIADDRLRAFSREHLAGKFVKNDPEFAAEWAAGLNEQPGGERVVDQVSRDWANRDPQATIQWLESLPTSEGRTEGFGSAFRSWASRDPEAAGNYLNDMPRSPERDSALGGFASRIMHEDPVTAISWAEAIADPGHREEALIKTGRHYFRHQTQAAAEWLTGSGLSEEAQQRIRSRD